MMKIGILTSSRADFGIYLPLLKILRKDSFFKLEIIVLGGTITSYPHDYVEDFIRDIYYAANTFYDVDVDEFDFKDIKGYKTPREKKFLTEDSPQSG